VKTVINESIRGDDVFIFQDVANQETGTINDNMMVLFTAIDACKHASANEVNVVVPTFPYARQHKKAKREGLSAAMLCRFFDVLGVSKIVTLDIHSREIQNSFNYTILENLHASTQIVKILKDESHDFSNTVVVSPDSGAVDRNKYFANNLGLPLCMIYKERDYSKISTSAEDSNITNMRLLGNVSGKDVLMTDDMIDTGGSWLNAARCVKENGATSVTGACSLGFFNNPAIDDFNKAYEEGIFDKIVVTDAVYKPNLWTIPWIRVASVIELFSEVVYNICEKKSISNLLDSSITIQEVLRA
jgi:ribose-phosphate pyrophosphokinase